MNDETEIEDLTDQINTLEQDLSDTEGKIEDLEDEVSSLKNQLENEEEWSSEAVDLLIKSGIIPNSPNVSLTELRQALLKYL